MPSVRLPPAPCPPPSARLVASLGRAITGTGAPGVFLTVGRHRRLSRWWLPFAGCLLLRGRIPRRDAELVVLRTAYNCSAWYEWVQHAAMGHRAGLSDREVAAVPVGPDHPGWTARQQLLLRVTDELHQARVITDSTWAALASDMAPEDCIELCFLVGHYEMVAMVVNSLGVRPEREELGRLAPEAASVGEQLSQDLGRSRHRPAVD